MLSGWGQGHRLGSLQAGRAVAALAVVAHHAASGTLAFVGPLPSAIAGPASFGWVGVDFFFVLSGFIIFYSANASSHSTGAASRFFPHRLVRVYAPYLPVSLTLILAYGLMPSLSGSNRDWNLLTSLTLLPLPYPPALSIAWTLQHEMLFYCIFAVSFYRGRLFLALAAWAAAILLSATTGIGADGPFHLILAPQNFDFMLGIAAAILAPRSSVLRSWICALVMMAAFAAWWATGPDANPSTVLLGVGMAALIVLLVRLEIAGRLRVPPWLVMIGAASYSIYLVHSPVLSVTQRVFGHLGFRNDACLALALGAGISIAAGIAYHFAIEKQVIRILRR